MRRISQHLPLLLVLLLPVITILPLFHEGFFTMHDNTQVARVFEMTKALHDGQFPVRWIADLGYGYGYPLFNFYAPLAYYVGGIIGFGVAALTATKLMVGIGVLLASFGMFLLGRQLWGTFGGIVSSILYVFAPYHALDTYVRGDMSEMYAYALIPFVFYGMCGYYKTKRSFYLFITSVSFAAIILAHNLTAFMISPFVGAFFLLLATYFGKKHMKKEVLYLAISLLLGVLLAAFYWLPAIGEISKTNVLSQVGGSADFRNHFVCLPQLWDSPWGFAGSAPGCADGLSFRIGKVHILFFLITILLFITSRQQRKRTRWILGFLIAAAFFSCFMLLEQSRFIWEFIKPLAILQYPWRFLLPISFFVSISAGSVGLFVTDEKNLKQIISAIAIGILLIGSIVISAKLFVPQQYVSHSSAYFTTQNELEWNTSKISDEYLPRQFSKPTNMHDIAIQKISSDEFIHSVFVKKENTTSYIAAITSIAPVPVTIRIAPFPGWVASIDGKTVQIAPTKLGYTLQFPIGTHTLSLTRHESTIELTGDLLSLAGVLGLIAGIIYMRHHRYEKTS